MGITRPAAVFGVVLALAFGIPAPAGAGGGKGLDRIPRAKVLEDAKAIDRLVDADLAAHRIRPNPPLDDAGFVRRVYLDLVGRIPTPKEVADFHTGSLSERRAALIDRLLDSPGYVSHMFNDLADLLRVKTRLNNNISGEPYIHFIKESLAENKPWDVFVRELLTASGPAHQRGRGATGYYLRDRGMPEDNMSNTITIFLGTRLECAQCHDHPFDRWTQKQYHEMVAFTGGLRYTDSGFLATPEGRRLMEIGNSFKSAEKGKETRSVEYREFRRMLQPLEYGVSGSGTGLYRLPKDYQYSDAKPNEVVKAKAMFGKEVEVKAEAPAADPRAKANPKRAQRAPEPRGSEVNSREAYAKWLANPENPRFTTVVANRLWSKLFGIGVIEPAYNLREDTKPVNPALMKQLEALMVSLGYDLKQYLRVLANTQAYQREACRKEASDEEVFRFPGPLLRRLSAEQMWDSMVTLVVPDVDSTLLPPGAAAEALYRSYDQLANLGPEAARKTVEMEVLRTKDPARYREMKRAEAETARDALRTDADLRKKTAALEEEAKAARKKGDEAAARRIREELRALVQEQAMDMMAPDPRRAYRKESRPGGLQRASDVAQPAPPGHFLREFGQSDREQIDASHTESTVPQVLSLLNGFVDKTLLPNAKASIRLDVAAAPNALEKLRTLFRGTLSRDPSPKERETWLPDLEKRGDAAIKDLLWALVNTHEFMFVR
jgi:hypothetical protein